MPDVARPGAHGNERWQEVAPGEFAPQVYATSAITAAVALRRFFIAGTGALVLAAAGNDRATLTNPTGSGVNVFVARMSIFSNVAGEAALLVNPTAGLPAGSRPQLNAVVGAAGGKAVVAADSDATVALSGGTDTGVLIPFPANTRTQIDLPPLILAPGVTLGLNVPIAAASSRTTMSIYWFEEAPS